MNWRAAAGSGWRKMTYSMSSMLMVPSHVAGLRPSRAVALRVRHARRPRPSPFGSLRIRPRSAPGPALRDYLMIMSIVTLSSFSSPEMARGNWKYEPCRRRAWRLAEEARHRLDHRRSYPCHGRRGALDRAQRWRERKMAAFIGRAESRDGRRRLRQKAPSRRFGLEVALAARYAVGR